MQPPFLERLTERAADEATECHLARAARGTSARRGYRAEWRKVDAFVMEAHEPVERLKDRRRFASFELVARPLGKRTPRTDHTVCFERVVRETPAASRCNQDRKVHHCTLTLADQLMTNVETSSRADRRIWSAGLSSACPENERRASLYAFGFIE